MKRRGLAAREKSLRRRLKDHLRRIGIGGECPGDEFTQEVKERYRTTHDAQRAAKLMDNRRFLADRVGLFGVFFANGDEVDPALVSPRLEQVKGSTWQSDLFRLATLSWRVPVSDGYGRRLRFLVWDRQNEKLIGVIALGDAVFNLRVRDQKIGWSHIDRSDRLVNIMDAYVLGAVPPYNRLLGGKLVACAVRTKEVVAVFKRRYLNSKGIISKKKKKPRLAVVTTSSALGRSSVYNRLRLGNLTYFEQLGFTSGWGHFHVPDPVFAAMRELLELHGDAYAAGHKFGDGPNWRLRAVRKSLELLGLDPHLTKHGLQREVFMCCLASNALEYLRGQVARPKYDGLLTLDEVASLARERWIVPRAARHPEYREWRAEMFFRELAGNLD